MTYTIYNFLTGEFISKYDNIKTLVDFYKKNKIYDVILYDENKKINILLSLLEFIKPIDDLYDIYTIEESFFTETIYQQKIAKHCILYTGDFIELNKDKIINNVPLISLYNNLKDKISIYTCYDLLKVDFSCGFISNTRVGQQVYFCDLAIKYRNDRDFILNNINIILEIPVEDENDDDFYWHEQTSFVSIISSELKNDETFWLDKRLRNCGSQVYLFMSERLQNDKNFLIEFMKNNPCAFIYIEDLGHHRYCISETFQHITLDFIRRYRILYRFINERKVSCVLNDNLLRDYEFICKLNEINNEMMAHYIPL